MIIDRIVVENLGMAHAIARRYTGRGADSEELVQVASVALVAAAQRFDLRRGRDFVSFAVPTIVGEVKRHFRDHSWSVRPPRRLQELRAALENRAQEAASAVADAAGGAAGLIPAAAIFVAVCVLGWRVFNRESRRVAEAL